MKKYIFPLIVFGVCSFLSCEDVQKRPEGGTWDTGPIQDYTVTPINGGAVVRYTIAEDPDILYIMAEYERNGKIFTEKSSVHKNSLTIEGFHRTKSVTAKLYKVNKKEQRSAPIEVTFEPLESIIDIASKTWNATPSFGGFIASWNNPLKTELGVHLMTEDEENPNNWVSREMYFSVNKNERHPFRGFDAVERKFAVTIEDKWGNISDTLKFSSTPLFEIMIPKPYADYRQMIPYDNTSNYTSRNINMLWDNIVNTSGHGWLTASGNSGLSITFDMKQVAILSRIVIHPYHINSMYGQANITDFEVWGTNSVDLSQDKSYWLDSLSVAEGRIAGVPAGTQLPAKTFKDDWQYLGYHSMPREHEGDAAAIAAFCNAGGEYTMPVEAFPVRYIRIFVRGIAKSIPPPESNYFSMGEITFYGNNTVPQN